jgi:sulfur oxidation c-type cytochrome SoxX
MNRIQTEILLGTIFILLTGFILIFVGVNENNRMAVFTEAQQARDIEVGASLFETNCTGCHGPKGEGTLGLCPPLNDVNFFNNRMKEVGWSGSLEDYIVSTVSAGRLVSTRPDQYPGQGHPAMPAWSQDFGGPLRDDQIRSIASFIMNWQATATGEVTLQVVPTPTPSAAEAADPVSRGKQVFTSNACIGCHTIEGVSAGTVGPNLTHIGTEAASMVAGQSAEDYIRQSIVNPGAFIVPNYQDLMPKNFSDLLTQQQIDDLVAYLLDQK